MMYSSDTIIITGNYRYTLVDCGRFRFRRSNEVATVGFNADPLFVRNRKQVLLSP